MKKIIFVILALVVTVLVLLRMVSERKVKIELKKPVVVASFYPYYFIASEIMGVRGTVRNITPSGSEPHDYELTTGDRLLLEQSDLVLMNGAQMEPWGKDVQKILDEKKIFKIGERFAVEKDPHVWLDPVIMMEIANLVTQKLIEIDPNATNLYRANSSNLIAKLYELDQSFMTGLRNCQKDEIITAHEAFSYPARRYGFKQISIVGISPEAEPGVKDLAEITRIAREKDIKVIFFETLVGPKLASTIAAEIGATTSVLDPLEGLSDESLKAGKNYFTEMNKNLTNLKSAMICQ